jgi:hypothetical protein
MKLDNLFCYSRERKYINLEDIRDTIVHSSSLLLVLLFSD